jgi:hypothetical protein
MIRWVIEKQLTGTGFQLIKLCEKLWMQKYCNHIVIQGDTNGLG